MKDFFEVLKKDKKTKAKRGRLNTAHGQILTPAFVPVGSQATVKSLSSEDLKEIGTQVFFVNTYHLYLRPKADLIRKLSGLHRFMNWSGPIMSDSGGFQVFSLGRLENQVKIDYHGVTFYSHLDGSKHYFTPRKSIAIQKKLGADMMVAFDECPPYPVKHDYAKLAMERTHRWAKQSLGAAENRSHQFLFGVIQGGVFQDLRVASTKFISSLPFDGLAIGGVAVGESKKEMLQVLDWVMPVLSSLKSFKKPVHLLGVGEVDDVFKAVERGVDMMDCVIPTRLGRMGHILSQKAKDFKYDVTKVKFADDLRSLDENCHCFVCQNYSRAYLHHLFRCKELLAYRLATYHNLYFMEDLFARIREAIKNDCFKELKKEWLK